MNPILTYETVRESEGDVRVYAIMNKDFVSALTHPNLLRVFGPVADRFVVMADGGKEFALVVDADRNESALTEAIDLVNETGIETDIRTRQVENRLGFGTDINTTAASLEDVLKKVEGWLLMGEFAPEPAEVLEFPH